MAKAKKLPSGNWRVQATAHGQTKSFTGPDRKMVEIEAAQWQAGITDTPNELTLDKAYDRYIESKSKVLSPATIRKYKTMRRTYFQDLMLYRVDKIKSEMIQRSVNEIAAEHSPKTVRNIYGLLTAVLSVYRPQFRPNISLPQKVKPEIYVPTKSEVKAVLEAAKGTGYYTAILLGACCGMRAGEICALDSDDIHDGKIHVKKSLVCGEDGQWRTKPPKSFSGDRNIEMPETVKNALQGIQGKIVPYNPHSLSVGFRRILKKNNLPLFRFHDLRHFYVSELFDMGLPEKYIIAQVGHSSASITKAVYDHINSERQSEYALDIAKRFSDF